MQGERSRVQGPLPLGQTPGAWLLSWPFLGLPAGPACWPAPPSFLLRPCLSLWKQSLFLPSSPELPWPCFCVPCVSTTHRLITVSPAALPGSEAAHSHQHPPPFCSFSELFVFA